MTDVPTRQAIEAVWRIESARILGALVRLARDVELAEDAAQEALVAALERWPRSGVPDEPGAWLMAVARRRALDALRHRRAADEKHAVLAAEASDAHHDPPPRDARGKADDEARDDLLRLILMTCHPVLSKEARVALTLRLLGGLSIDEIARAFLVPEPTVAQRIVRAKRTLAEARVPFEAPEGEELVARLPAVLEVLYLVFNEGYAAARGDHRLRPELCEEALRLARILVGLVPGEAEVHGLLALMELNASRFRARHGPDGEPVLLLDQDRSRWDRLLVQRGLAALERATALRQPLGPYTLQAGIAACHARARVAEETDWPRIVALYDALVELTGSPVVELNRAMAVAMAFGAEQGLALADALAGEPALEGYHLLPAVRGELLARLGRREEARAELERAAALATNAVDRRQLRARARECAEPGTG